MDAKTLEALKASIAKWNKNAKAKEPQDVVLGSDNCPLCDLFQTEVDICNGCPVFQSTGSRFCFATPYGQAVNGLRHWRMFGDRQKFRDAAEAEVAFLKSLLPEETP